MKIVIKIGGQAQEDAEQRRNITRQIAKIRRAGHRVAVVHGGGKLLTQTLERLGITSEFHQGLRVTDAATRDVALMVLAGIVNKRWVADLETAGQPAFGICGGDAGLVEARKYSAGSNGNRRDLGFVGRPRKVNTAILEMAFSRGMVPVVASLALDGRGEYFNVNADDFAAALAVALKADRLFYLTESGGVWDANRELLPLVRLGEIRKMIAGGIVRDGMIPKLRSCARTLGHGVREIDIISSAIPKGLLQALAAKHSIGTRIVNK
ncbi:MAG TPA: acetylglutamate kinase [Terriglobia bacterium]|nr:acetylglutamate kinase [Terriglobia bacterium]